MSSIWIKLKTFSVDKEARISALFDTGNYAQQEVARIRAPRQIVYGIAYLIKETIPATTTSRSNCGRIMKRSVREDRRIIKLVIEKRRIGSKGIKKSLMKKE